LDALLGLLLLALYVAAIVALASAVTYGAVKIFPTRDYSKEKDKDGDSTPKPPSDGSSSGGRLFRKAKRGAA
jgi:hypothetical protein